MRDRAMFAVLGVSGICAAANAGPVFLPYAQWPTSAAPAGLAVGDVDHDGDLDVATAHQGANSISVLLNDGAGALGPPASFAIANGPSRVFLADLNADGFADIVAPISSGKSVTVRLNDTAGGFAASQIYNFSASSKSIESIAFGDINGDGDIDMMIGTYDLNSTGVATSQVVLLRNNGSGAFGAPLITYFSGKNPAGLALHDMDGDLDLDLMIGSKNTGSVFAGGVIGSANLGSGTFNGAAGFQDATATHVRIGDIDGDTVPDVCALLQLGRPRFLKNLGGLVFAPSVDITSIGAVRAVDFGLADVNGDGFLDCIIADESNSVNEDSRIAFQINGGTGLFRYPMTAPLPAPAPGEGVTHLRWLTIADMNGDTYPDVVVTLADHDAVCVVLNKGPMPPSDLCLGDINRDFVVDVNDFNYLATQFGYTVPPFYHGDLDGNGIINVADFSIYATDFGRVCD